MNSRLTCQNIWQADVTIPVGFNKRRSSPSVPYFVKEQRWLPASVFEWFSAVPSYDRDLHPRTRLSKRARFPLRIILETVPVVCCDNRLVPTYCSQHLERCMWSRNELQLVSASVKYARKVINMRWMGCHKWVIGVKKPNSFTQNVKLTL